MAIFFFSTKTLHKCHGMSFANVFVFVVNVKNKFAAVQIDVIRWDDSRIKKTVVFFSQEISFDVFLQVIWEDKRIHHRNNTIEQKYIELKLEERHKLWVIFSLSEFWRASNISHIDVFFIGTEFCFLEAIQNLEGFMYS